MSADWKPGDLAMAQCSDSRWRPAFYAKAPNGSGVWRFADGMMRSEEITYARRLVVIDPNDRASIERFRDIFDSEVIKQNDDPDPRDVSPSARASAMQAALREFANPTPRIEEPQGLGAVVEDAAGHRWTRADESGMPWLSRFHGNLNQQRWANLTPVRILAPGVTA